MPTAGKLIAAVLFGALTFYVSYIAVPYFPEGKVPPMWLPVNVVAGVIMGWIVAGSRAGTGLSSAIGYGITAGVSILFWIFFAHSFWRMIDKSLSRRYKGAMQAVVDVVNLPFDMAKLLAIPELIFTFFVGCLVAAVVVDWVGKRFS
jgi:hypothetical protein